MKLMELLALFLLTTVGLLLGVRLTEYALALGFEIVESAANTFTQVLIDTPVGQLNSSGKVQAMECMYIEYDLLSPSQEDDMDNFTQVQLTDSSQTGIIGQNRSEVFWRQVAEKAVAAGAESIWIQQSTLNEDLTDKDGNGRLFYAGTMFGAIVGTGNASARFCDGKVYYHLIELTAEDVVQALLTA